MPVLVDNEIIQGHHTVKRTGNAGDSKRFAAKKLFLLTVCLIMSIMPIVSAYATDSSNMSIPLTREAEIANIDTNAEILTVEEFEMQLNAAFAGKGVSFEFLEVDPDFVFTTAALNDMIKEAQIYATGWECTLLPATTSIDADSK